MYQGEELLEKNLRPSFKLGRTNIEIFTCIAKEDYFRIVLVRKMTKREHVTLDDRFGLNVVQFA